jgi:hypothetical protein
MATPARAQRLKLRTYASDTQALSQSDRGISADGAKRTCQVHTIMSVSRGGTEII